MAKYEITSPSGKTLEIEGDTPPTEQELDEIFRTVDTDPTLPAISLNEDGSLNQPLQGKVTFNEELKKYGKEQLEKRKQWEQDHPIISEFQQNWQPGYRSAVPQWEEWAEYGGKAPIGKALKTDAKRYGLETIPATNAALAIGTGGAGNIGKMIGEGALLGGTAAGLDELGDNGLSPNVALQTAKGAGIGAIANPAIVGGIGAIRSGLGKLLNAEGFKNSIGKGLELLTSVPKKFTKRALNAELSGNSIFKGKFDKDTAYIPVERELNKAINRLPEKEYYAKIYSDLAKKAKTGIDKKLLEKNQELNAIIKQMPESASDISGLRASIDEGLDKFRFGDVNPALEEAGGVINNAKRQLGFTNADDLKQALSNYAEKYKMNNGIGEYGGLNKDQQESAFAILEKATGKNRQWLKSQLNANAPKHSTVKRQEFIYNLLDKTDDKIDEGLMDYRTFDPSLTSENLATDNMAGTNGAYNAYNRIINRDFNKVYTAPDEAMGNEISIAYSKILDDLVKEPDVNGYTKALDRLDKLTSQYNDKQATDLIFDQFMKDWDNIENIVNPKVKPATLHGVKEQLYDRANFSGENFGNYGNSGIKSVAQDINEYLRAQHPDYARINDDLKLLNSVKYDVGGPQGINQNTLAAKLKGIGSEANTLNNMDERLKNLNYLIEPEYRFFDDAKQLAETQEAQNEMLKLIGADAKMRNPRLLDNITDERRLNALAQLQRQTGTNFMDDLERIRAREALENFLPGQGGGSGSAQGFGNLLRTAIIGGSPATAAITHNPLALAGLGLISPKLMAKGTIQNIGRLNRLNNVEIPKGLYNMLIQNLGNEAGE